MPKPIYRHLLPQVNGTQMLTDGGLETTLIYHQGLDLPYFAAFDLLRTQRGREIIRDYYQPYIDVARKDGKGFVLDAPTWRASRDWGAKLGYSPNALGRINRDAIELLAEIRSEVSADKEPFVLSGNVGPRGDGYDPDVRMTPDEAQSYHTAQVQTFSTTVADMITALTMTHVEEAIGIARAASDAGIPAAISFTLETDGRLPTGQSLGDAICQVDDETSGGPAYFMINCAHPTHFSSTLPDDAAWTHRIMGLRANASRMSHAELDAAEELDSGNPRELGLQYGALRNALPNLSVLGGCCGTDHRHVAHISQTCA